MFRGNRKTLVEKRIMERKDYIRMRDPIKVVQCDPFYFIVFYSTIIMVGFMGNAPFAFNLHGWGTRTTLDIIRSFGFDVRRERRVYDVVFNKRTKRKNTIYHNPLCIKGKQFDVDEWHDLDGNPCNFNFSNLAAIEYVSNRITVALEKHKEFNGLVFRVT